MISAPVRWLCLTALAVNVVNFNSAMGSTLGRMGIPEFTAPADRE
jgi:hypothetical protein